MKVNIETTEKKFESFTLEITLETKEEAQMVWHRFNIGMSRLRSGSPPCSCAFPKKNIADLVRNTLNDYMEVYNLKGE